MNSFLRNAYQYFYIFTGIFFIMLLVNPSRGIALINKYICVSVAASWPWPCMLGISPDAVQR